MYGIKFKSTNNPTGRRWQYLILFTVLIVYFLVCYITTLLYIYILPASVTCSLNISGENLKVFYAQYFPRFYRLLIKEDFASFCSQTFKVSRCIVFTYKYCMSFLFANIPYPIPKRLWSKSLAYFVVPSYGGSTINSYCLV